MGLYDFQPETNASKTGQNTSFIPNPLPVPTRKEHVEMDYDHEVMPQAMKYDIERPANMEFDI